MGLTLQADGKILVSGRSKNADIDIVVLRINNDGTADNTFGPNGVFQIDLGGDQSAQNILLQNDGKIVVTGYTNNDVFIMRLKSSLDMGTTELTFYRNVKIYPNPAQSNVIFEMEGLGSKKADIAILTIDGREIKKLNVDFENQVSIDLHEMANGTYLIQLKIDRLTSVYRIIKI